MAIRCPRRRCSTKFGTAFRKAVNDYAEANDIPMVRFKKGDRKADVMKPYLAKAIRPGVVAIGVAQEFQKVFSAYDRAKDNPRLASYARDANHRGWQYAPCDSAAGDDREETNRTSLHQTQADSAGRTALGRRVVEEGQRTAALRFGEPRVMALSGALCALVCAAVGFTNRSFCPGEIAARRSLHQRADDL